MDTMERQTARAARSTIKLLLLSMALVTTLAGTMLGFAQTSASFAQEAKQIVAAAEQPKTKAPDLPAIDAGAKLKGKLIFYLSAGLSFPFSQEVLKGVQDASAVLGMTVVTADAMAAGSCRRIELYRSRREPGLGGNRAAGHRCLHRSGLPRGSQGGAHPGDHGRGAAARNIGEGTRGHGRFRVRQFLGCRGRQGDGRLCRSQRGARCACVADQLLDFPDR